jgi:hypothetical protein
MIVSCTAGILISQTGAPNYAWISKNSPCAISLPKIATSRVVIPRQLFLVTPVFIAPLNIHSVGRILKTPSLLAPRFRLTPRFTSSMNLPDLRQSNQFSRLDRTDNLTRTDDSPSRTDGRSATNIAYRVTFTVTGSRELPVES